jgi:hypothetical protein
MKKIYTLIAVLVLVIAYSSCTSGPQKPAQNRPTADLSDDNSFESQEMKFRESVTSEDTLQMLSLADKCMEFLHNKDIDQAIAMLHEYDGANKQIKDLSSETENRLRRQFSIFPVLKYQRDYFSFMLEGLNDVRYRVWFAEDADPNSNGESVTTYMFNPVLVNGTWYLCVKDRDQISDEMRR